jgi:surface antigen
MTLASIFFSYNTAEAAKYHPPARHGHQATTERQVGVPPGQRSNQSQARSRNASSSRQTATTRPHNVALDGHPPVYRTTPYRSVMTFSQRGLDRSQAQPTTTRISCVPYVKMVTGMNISGDGKMWWDNASGRYLRSIEPEPGSVMAFAASPGMSRGHVAVVRSVLNSRLITIDHANWGGPGIRSGSVMLGVQVSDVSENNDWSQVRVQTGHSAGNFGRIYAANGFIYNVPDYTATIAGRSRAMDEVAEAPPPRQRRN